MQGLGLTEAGVGVDHRQAILVDDLGLTGTGVEVDHREAIVVDDRLETSQPGVFAIGDVSNVRSSR